MTAFTTCTDSSASFSLDRDYLATMYRCHGSIGRALYYTTLTVVIGFSTLTLSNFNPSLYFGHADGAGHERRGHRRAAAAAAA
jgi:hypothetical protein